MRTRPRSPTAASATALLLALSLLGGGAARGGGLAGPWGPVELEPGATKALVDGRSPTFPHERELAFGEALEIDGGSITFTRDRGGGVLVCHDRPDGTESQSSLHELPALLTLDAFGVEYGLSVREAGEGLRVSSAYGFPIRLDREVAWVVDSNLDGYVGRKGDGYVAPRSRTVAPWVREAWGPTTALAVTRGGKTGWQAAPLAMPHPGDEDHSRAFRLLQWRRQQCGLAPVRYDDSLEDGIRAHAAYCVRNGYQGHDEDPDREGYSPEGDRAGKRCVFGFGKAGALPGMVEQLATLYHRSGPLGPGLVKTAFVIHEGVFGLDIRSGSRGAMRSAPLVFPPHGMTEAPVQFNPGGEIPMPVAGRAPVRNGLGTAIAVFFHTPTLTLATGEPPVLEAYAVPAHGRPEPVEGAFHYPGSPPDTGVELANLGEVALVPLAPLARGTRYRCRVSIPRKSGPFEYEWEFETR